MANVHTFEENEVANYVRQEIYGRRFQVSNAHPTGYSIAPSRVHRALAPFVVQLTTRQQLSRLLLIIERDALTSEPRGPIK